jgi:hypothetical protein
MPCSLDFVLRPTGCSQLVYELLVLRAAAVVSGIFGFLGL